MFFFTDEVDLYDNLETRRSQFNAVADSLTVDQARSVAALAEQFPAADPGVITGMGLSGMTADMPLAEQIATLSAEQLLGDPTSMLRPGQPVNGDALRRQLQAAQQEQQLVNTGEPDSDKSWGELPVWGKVTRGLSNTAGALLRGADIAFEGAAQEVANVVTSGVEAAFDEDTSGGFQGWLEDSVDNFQGQTSFWREAWRETGRRLDAGMRPWEQEFYEGSEELVGSGLVVSSGSFAENVQEADEQLRVPGTDLHYTPGRAVIQPFVEVNAIEPGSRAYQTVSGMLDFANRLFADPANLIPVAGVGNKLSKVDDIADFLPEATRGLQSMRSSLLRGPRRTVLFNGAEQELTGGTAAGRRMVEGMATLVDDMRQQGLDADQIAAHVRQATSGSLPVNLTLKIADAESPDDVIAALREGLKEVEPSRMQVGGRLPELSRRLKNDGISIKGHQLVGARPFNLIPNSKPLTVDNVGEAAEELDRWLGNLELDSGERARLVGQLMRTDTMEDAVEAREQFANVMLQAGHHATNTLLNRNENIPRGVAQKLTEIVDDAARGDASLLRAYLTDELGQEIPSPGARIREEVVDPRTGEVELKTRRLEAGQVAMILSDDADAPIVEVLPTARTIAQHAEGGIRLPDAKAIRRQLSLVGRMGISDSTPVEVLRNVLQPLWVTTTLGRPALAIRVVAENQIRMASYGLDSMFKHPVSYIAALMGRRNTGTLLDDAWERTQRDFDTNSTFVELHDPNGGRLPATLQTQDFRLVTRGDRGFSGYWAQRVHHYARQEEFQAVARMSREDAIDWFWEGEGAAIRRRLNKGSLDGQLNSRTAVGEYVDSINMQIAALTGGRLKRDARGIPHGIDVDGNAELREMFATGQLRGKGVLVTRGDGAPLRYLRDQLDGEFNGYAPEKVPAPREGDGFFENADGIGERTMEKMNAALSGFFDMILSRHEDALSRNPAFRQLYWERVADQADRMSDDLLDEVIRRAEKAKLDGSVIQSFRRQLKLTSDNDVYARLVEARKGKRTGELDDMEALDVYSASHAAEDMKSLLYDFSNRSNFFDAMRLIMPFGEAWRDIVLTWTRLLRNDPARVVRRGQQVVRAGRNSDPLELLPGGSGDPSEHGFFYTDDNGQEVFAYPDFALGLPMALTGGALAGVAQGGIGRMAQSAAKGVFGATPAGRVGQLATGVASMLGSRPAQGAMAAVAGGLGVAAGAGANDADNENAEVAFTGTLEGLNLVSGQMLPGVGPVVQLPASMLLDGDNDEALLNRMLLPYGPQSPAEAVTPPWVDKLMDGLRGDPDSDRRLGNITIDVARTLAASGEYTNDAGLIDNENATRLHEDAVRYARQLMMIRGAAQSTMPTGPQMEFRVRNGSSERGYFTFNAIADEYRKRMDEVGPDEALREFIDLFGVDLASVLQPKTISIRERSVDPVGADWERDNPELVDKYPNTVGFFAPESGLGFDFAAYQDQLEQGDRDKLTPQETIYLANNRVAQAIYYAQRDKLGDTANTVEGRILLSELRASLRATYPGYGQTEGLGGRIDVQGAVSELENAVLDERLADNPVADAARQYLSVRQDAIEQLQAMGMTGRESLQSATRPEVVAIRDRLRETGQRLARIEPRFAGMWRGVFDRELRNDDDVASVSQEVLPLARLGLAGLASTGGVSVTN